MLYYLNHRTLLIGGCHGDASLLFRCLNRVKAGYFASISKQCLSSSSWLETVRWKYSRVMCRWPM